MTGTIEDDDDPAVTVSFGRSRYEVAEGRSVDVAVRLDKDPERTVTVPLEATHLGGASPADYAGVPLEVTFGPGQRSAEFVFSATVDGEEETGESVELQFGSLLPFGVTAGPAAVVAIRDNDDGGRGPGGGDPGGRRPPRPPNRPPEAVGTLADQALTVGADPVQVDVAAAFRDPDRDALEYAAESSAEDVAAVAADGSVVTVTPVGAGTAAVTVTASDGEEGNAPAEQAFTVTVVVDYDSDADGLIEVRTPAQLDAVRHDLDGDGAPAETGAEAHAAAFAGAIGGVSCAGAGGCRGLRAAGGPGLRHERQRRPRRGRRLLERRLGVAADRDGGRAVRGGVRGQRAGDPPAVRRRGRGVRARACSGRRRRRASSPGWGSLRRT